MAPQAYRLTITRDAVDLTGATPVGLWYGLKTLEQLVLSGGGRLNCVRIDDAPDFEVRGVMLDVSRDKVPTMRTLKRLIDGFARLRLNQLQLYTEHTFAYRRHRTAWRGASPLTAAEVRKLDRFCTERFIELVPNQNCFGHMERWLRHARYRPLSEATGPWTDPWGRTRTAPATLNPLDPRSLALVRSLLDELLPQFASRRVNVGFDETFELGQGRSRDACRRRGVGAVYLDFLLKVHRLVRSRGHRMHFWADIVHQHPRLIPRLPRDAVPLEWGYEADHPFDAHGAALAKAGLRFYVCPGTSTWCSFAGRTENARRNLLSAAIAGRKHGADGFLITDWGDLGHRQYLPASYGPIAYGAAVSWCAAANRDLDETVAASEPFFDEARPDLATLWSAAGKLYRQTGVTLKNKTIFFHIMQTPLQTAIRPPERRDDPLAGLTPARLAATERAIRQLRRSSARVRPGSSEAVLAQRELLVTLDVLAHACRRAAAIVDARRGRARAATWRELASSIRRIISDHRALWMARNRPGGFSGSVSHYQRNLDEYRAAMRGAASSMRQIRSRAPAPAGTGLW